MILSGSKLSENLEEYGASSSWYANEADADARGNYGFHYPAIIDWFKDASSGSWNANKVIQGSLMVYGWMPTIFEGRKSTDRLTKDSAKAFAMALEDAKDAPENLPETWWNFVNGSFVGTSKFLHFWRPNNFAIWDMNVALALVDRNFELGSISRDHIERIDIVRTYQNSMRGLSASKKQSLRDLEIGLFRYGQLLRARRLKHEQ